MIGIDLQNRLDAIELIPAAARTATVTGTGKDIRDYVGKLKLILSSEVTNGATVTLDVKIQDSADNSTFADVTGATFTQVTNSAAAFESIELDTRSVKRYIRAVGTIAGTTPDFAQSVIAVGQKNVK